MHCPICDKDSDSVTLSKDCSECEEAINECLAGYPNDDDPIELLEEGWDDLGL